MITDPETRISNCLAARAVATNSLVRVLKDALASRCAGERSRFQRSLVAEMRKSPVILSTGWNDSRPSGVAVLFSNENNFDRVNFRSLRTEDRWPQTNQYLDRSTGICTFYASPIDAATGMIGDLGVRLYLGSNKKIQRHLRNSLALNKALFSAVRQGVSLRAIHARGTQLMTLNGWVNNVASMTDPTTETSVTRFRFRCRMECTRDGADCCHDITFPPAHGERTADVADAKRSKCGQRCS